MLRRHFPIDWVDPLAAPPARSGPASAPAGKLVTAVRPTPSDGLVGATSRDELADEEAQQDDDDDDRRAGGDLLLVFALR